MHLLSIWLMFEIFVGISYLILVIFILMHFFYKLYLQCENGWYGVDCSVPSVWSSIVEWPQWVRPRHIDVPDSSQLIGTLYNLNAVVQKKRPLIYVYDLPPDFNSLLLEVNSHQTLISSHIW